MLESLSPQTTGRKKNKPTKFKRPSPSLLSQIRPFSQPTTKECTKKNCKTSGTTKEEIPSLDLQGRMLQAAGGDHSLLKAEQVSKSLRRPKLLANELRGCMTKPIGTQSRNRTKAIYGLVHSPLVQSLGRRSTTYTNKISQASILNQELTSGNKWIPESGKSSANNSKTMKNSSGILSNIPLSESTSSSEF